MKTQINFPDFNQKKITEEKLIGNGGFGNVYKTHFLSNKIAKKTMKVNDIPVFLKEAVFTHVLKNVNSVTLLGIKEIFTKSNREVSLLLEYIDGYSLETYISKVTDISNPINEILNLMYMFDLAKSLQFLHSNNIIHRDIKPSNIMVDKNYDLKLIDFGISKEKTNTFTQTKQKGTYLYSPPENLCNDVLRETDENSFFATDLNNKSSMRSISCSFDIWAFGLVLSELFSGETPWGKKKNFVISNLLNQIKFPIPEVITNKKIQLLIELCTFINSSDRIDISTAQIILYDLILSKVKNIKKEYFLSLTKNQKLNFSLKIKKLLAFSKNLKIPSYFELFYRVGNVYFNNKSLIKAREYFYSALEYSIDDGNKLLHIANDFLNNEEIELAKTYSEYVLKKNYTDDILKYNSLIILAKIVLKNKDWIQLESYIEEMMKINKNRENAFIYKSIIYENSKNYEEALDCINTALKINPKSDSIHIQISNIYLKTNKISQAEEHLNLAIKLNPSSKQAWIIFADIYILKKNYPEAEKYLKLSIENKHEMELCYIKLSEIYEKNNPSIANDYILKAFYINPKNEETLLILYRQNMILGKKKLAEKNLQDILSLNPYNIKALLNSAELLILKDPDTAFEMAARAQSIDELNPDVFSTYSKIFEKIGDIESSIKHCQQALLLNSLRQKSEETQKEKGFDKLYLQLGQLYYNKHSLDNAIDCFEKAIQYNFENDKAHLKLGSVLENKKDYDKSEKEYILACDLNPKDEQNFIFLINLYSKLNNYQKKKEALVKLFLNHPRSDYYQQKNASIQSVTIKYDNV